MNVGCEIWWTNTPSHKFAVSRVRKCKWSVQDKHVATSELFIHLPARSAATPLWHLGCFSMSVTVFTCHICSMVASCNLQHATVWFQAEHQCLCCHLCSDGRGFSCEESMPLITCVEVPMLWLPACSQSIRHEFQGTLAGERRKQSCVFMHMCIHNFQGCDTNIYELCCQTLAMSFCVPLPLQRQESSDLCSVTTPIRCENLTKSRGIINLGSDGYRGTSRYMHLQSQSLFAKRAEHCRTVAQGLIAYSHRNFQIFNQASGRILNSFRSSEFVLSSHLTMGSLKSLWSISTDANWRKLPNQRAKSQTSSLKNYKSVRLKYAFLPLNPPILTKNAVVAGFYLWKPNQIKRNRKPRVQRLPWHIQVHASAIPKSFCQTCRTLQNSGTRLDSL